MLGTQLDGVEKHGDTHLFVGDFGSNRGDAVGKGIYGGAVWGGIVAFEDSFKLLEGKLAVLDNGL